MLWNLRKITCIVGGSSSLVLTTGAALLNHYLNPAGEQEMEDAVGGRLVYGVLVSVAIVVTTLGTSWGSYLLGRRCEHRSKTFGTNSTYDSDSDNSEVSPLKIKLDMDNGTNNHGLEGTPLSTPNTTPFASPNKRNNNQGMSPK